MRIVSVLPSGTEIVCALGASGELVGRSAECDYPPEVRSRPVVMRPKTLDAERASAEIDSRVRAARAAGESLYELDLGELARLRPDLLLTQDLCGVCSVTDDEARVACLAAGVAPTILSTSPRTLEEVWWSIETIGAAIGRRSEAIALGRGLRSRTSSSTVPSPRTVLVLEWLDPPIEAGLWTTDLLRSAGGLPWSTEENAPAHRVDWAEIRRRPPELLIVSPCSFSVDRTLREVEGTPLGAELDRLRIPRGIWIADEAHFSRPGPRLAEGRDLVHRLLSGRSPGAILPVLPWAPPTRAA